MSYEDGMPSGGNSRFRGYPARMSERQQLALLLQMTSQEAPPGGNQNAGTQSTASRTPLQREQPRSTKSRWSNKNGESPVHSSISRKEDFRVRQMLNGYDSNIKESNENVGDSAVDDVKKAGSQSPRSPVETSVANSPSEQQEESSGEQQQQQRSAGNSSSSAQNVAEESGAPCEMRRTPPQNKVDRSGSGQSGNSPRVTLRLNQVRSARDEKKGTASNSRQGTMSAQSQGQMDSAKSTTNTPTTTSSLSSTTNAASSSDSGDVYEFKSSKEATPVRGSSSSPNPNPEKEKETTGGKSSSAGSQATSAQSGTTSSGSTATTNTPSDSNTTSTTEELPVSASPLVKRPLEGDQDDPDEENRRKKRKESDASKENPKGNQPGRQNVGRSTAVSDKCTKTGKQGSSTIAGKSSQSATSTNTDRKSPNAPSTASSPKPANTPTSASNSKTSTPAPPESDGEDDRSKSSDSGSAPKVPPLKIVIPQSTTSEQEQGGNRNGKNPLNRGHQLPYVVASSNSNDSMDKEPGQSASGTTSPTESTKGDDKKEPTAEERSTHHQRVLRSSHRGGNGANGSSNSKDSTGSSTGNGSHSNSSPLPANSADRSNNPSPQSQRHHSPTPERTTSEPSSKTTNSETSNSGGTTSKANGGGNEKQEKSEVGGNNKGQKESSDNSEGSTTTTSSSAASSTTTSAPVELHPRKRKMKQSKESQQAAATAAAAEAAEEKHTPEIHPHDQPITNCYQLFLNIRKQIDRRRKGLFPVQPKPPQGFKDYLMNRCTYVLAGTANKEPTINPPANLQGPMKDLYVHQEKERYRLRMQHVVEKEKLVLSVEQEILRVHGRAARALANQSLPFSVCTILKDEEVYNVITPEQEEKDRNARSRYNGRLFLSWLQDVDDKWEKIKEAMLLRHHNEAESLHAVQRMDWEWKLKEVGLCEFKATPQIEDLHVPIVHVSDDFDLLPA